MRGRPASPSDVGRVVELAHAMKRRLAEWSPTYFRPRAGAEERHAAFLRYLIGSRDHDTVVLEHDGQLVGFFVVVRQPLHRWVDDLYLRDDDRWVDAIEIIDAHAAVPWVTCVSRSDDRRAAAMRAAGLELRSTYWARTATANPAAAILPPEPLPMTLAGGPAHTFGGVPFDPTAPGALTVVAADGGHAIGSPGIEPPLYDPGGPSCVVDRIVGSDRAELLDAAMAAAARRGDAGIVVVADAGDDTLHELLARSGFRAEVDLLGRNPANPPNAVGPHAASGASPVMRAAAKR